MRKYHRYLAVIAVAFGLFISITGLLVQGMDLMSEARNAPANDPTMLGRRAGLFGPPNFVVIDVQDYAANNLRSDFDYATALKNAFRSPVARDGKVSFVQFRVLGNSPVVQVAANGFLHSLDPASGGAITPAQKIELKPISTPSTRNTIKDIHRMRWFGQWAILVDIFAGLAMSAMIFTGLALYVQLWRARFRMERRGPFWFAGDWWRTLHRSLSAIFGLFLAIIAISGTVLATSSIGVVINRALAGGQRNEITMDVSRPMSEADTNGMLQSTLAAWREEQASDQVRVLRLRYFAGMPQGVIVSGTQTPDQIVYNTATGKRVSLTEPNYPKPGQTFGWQVDETVKKIHRGDAFGVTGMGISMLSGLALLYLSISGSVMYFRLWQRRRKAGRRGLFWP